MIGNPPYVVTSDRKYRNFSTYDCHELYAYFFELSIKLLTPNGILSFITASLWVKGLKFEALRNYLESNLDLIEYQNKGDKIFDNVCMPTSTIIGKKGAGNWNCSDLNPLTKVTKKIELGQKQLYQISKIQRGLEIGRNDVCEEGDYPCITGTLVNKYLPHGVKYISKATLQAFSKDEIYFSRERILLRETGSFLMAIYLDQHLYSNRSLYSILITNNEYSTKYVLACLNSSLMQFYYQVKFKAETDLFPKIRIAQAKLLPIPSASKSIQNEIAAIIDKILGLKKKNAQADTSDMEKQIDRIIYDLYEITEDEIHLIEQA